MKAYNENIALFYRLKSLIPRDRYAQMSRAFVIPAMLRHVLCKMQNFQIPTFTFYIVFK
jgi:hypothetical protein